MLFCTLIHRTFFFLQVCLVKSRVWPMTELRAELPSTRWTTTACTQVGTCRHSLCLVMRCHHHLSQTISAFVAVSLFVQCLNFHCQLDHWKNLKQLPANRYLEDVDLVFSLVTVHQVVASLWFALCCKKIICCLTETKACFYSPIKLNVLTKCCDSSSRLETKQDLNTDWKGEVLYFSLICILNVKR